LAGKGEQPVGQAFFVRDGRLRVVPNVREDNAFQRVRIDGVYRACFTAAVGVSAATVKPVLHAVFAHSVFEGHRRPAIGAQDNAREDVDFIILTAGLDSMVGGALCVIHTPLYAVPCKTFNNGLMRTLYNYSAFRGGNKGLQGRDRRRKEFHVITSIFLY